MIARMLWQTTKQNRQISTRELLGKMMKSAEFERVAVATPDRRQFFAAAAKYVGLTEAQLMEKLAQKAKLTFIDKPLPIALEYIRGFCTVADLRRAGAILVTNGESISGIVCVDPSYATALIEQVECERIYISTWEAIARTLDESERLFRVKRAEVNNINTKKMLSLAERVFVMILEEVTNFGADSFKLDLAARDPYYSFSAQDGKLGTGTLSPSVRAALANTCEKYSSQGFDVDLVTRLGRDINGVTIVKSDKGDVYSVSWGGFEGALDRDRLTVGANDVADSHNKPAVIVVSNEIKRGSTKQASRNTKSLNKSDRVVLVIDDNPTFVKVLERYFAQQNIRVECVEGGSQALDKLKNGFRPSVIVCDVHMSEVSGIEILNFIRSHSNLVNTPVVMLTSDDNIETEIRLITAGADAFISKAQDPRVLYAHVKRLADTSAARNQAA